MARAVFIKNIETGHYYQRSIWYADGRESEVEDARNSWLDIEGTDPIIVVSSEEKGE